MKHVHTFESFLGKVNEGKEDFIRVEMSDEIKQYIDDNVEDAITGGYHNDELNKQLFPELVGKSTIEDLEGVVTFLHDLDQKMRAEFGKTERIGHVIFEPKIVDYLLTKLSDTFKA